MVSDDWYVMTGKSDDWRLATEIQDEVGKDGGGGREVRSIHFKVRDMQ